MIEKCYNNTYNKALRDGNLKGLLINNSLSGVIMTTANNTRYIERGQSRMPKLMHGIGFNSKRKHQAIVDGEKTKAYLTWYSMIQRCYDQKFKKRAPAYINCTVSDEWHDFQNFADWFYEHPHSELGYQLDKDLLVSGNKVYSADTCCLVPRELNMLLTSRAACRGAHPQGVCFDKSENKYLSSIRINGKKKNLGRFNCPDEAHQVYRTAKELHVKNKALEWQDRIACNVFQSLMNWTLDS